MSLCGQRLETDILISIHGSVLGCSPHFQNPYNFQEVGLKLKS